jgi:2'-5' RNA ligase
MTLVFLGSTDPAALPQLTAVVEDVARAGRPFAAALADGGGRPDNRRGGVAWLRLGTGQAEVVVLARAMDLALGTGAYAERPPLPHVTVARRVDQSLIDDLRATAQTLDVAWSVDRVALMRSHSGPQGSRYEELVGARLG